MAEENKVGKSEKPFAATEQKTYTAKKTGDKVTLVFKENRSYELKIGATYFQFPPFGSIEIEKSLLDHPDFKGEEKNFVVKS